MVPAVDSIREAAQALRMISKINKLYTEGGYFVIAGGFARDFYLQKPIKDIDIFYCATVHFFDRDIVWSKLQSLYKGRIQSPLTRNSCRYFRNDSRYQPKPVLTVQKKPHPFQFIDRTGQITIPFRQVYTVHEDESFARELVACFDYTICKAWINNFTKEVNFTQDFLEAVENKVLKLTQRPHSIGNAIVRLKRLRIKFPDYHIDLSSCYNEEEGKHILEKSEPKGEDSV